MTKEFDFEPFCSLDPERPYLRQPWTRGGFTYATNGHVLVRTPARADIAANPKGVDPSRVLAKFDAANGWSTLTLAMLPEPEFYKVWIEDFDDFGHPTQPRSVEGERVTSTCIRGFNIDLRYARLIADLPNCEFAPGNQDDPAYFRFDGGIGAVMGLRGTFDHHVPAPSAAQREGE